MHTKLHIQTKNNQLSWHRKNTAVGAFYNMLLYWGYTKLEQKAPSWTGTWNTNQHRYPRVYPVLSAISAQISTLANPGGSC